MNRLLEVCLVALTLVASVGAADHSAAQTLQKGISVAMATTTNATPMPEADDENAWIVTVVRDGALYFGTDRVTAAGLEEAMKSRPRNRDQKLYIKADARAPWADVERVVVAGRVVLFEAPVLLTSQPESPAPGTIVPPKGLEVLVGRPPGGTVATVVQLNSGPERPMLKLNNDPISWSALQGTLTQHFQKGDEKVVLLKADGQLPFADVVRAIDACRATGAKVVVATPER
jgi:biopolymer transport protein ExbD